MPTPLPSLPEMARLLGGEVVNGGVLAPGPGHSEDDRSLSVKPSRDAECGFVLNSFAGDDIQVCKDHVRQKLKLPEFEPAKPTKKKKNGNGAGAKSYSPTIAKYTYRNVDNSPHLQVHRTAAKKFFQHHWDGEMWKPGAPKGEKIPYRLPELIATPLTKPVYVVEGEGKADLLAELGFTVTSSSGGADDGKGSKWTPELNAYFKDRTVYILPDNDGPGRKHAQFVAKNLDPIAKAVRVVELPGLPPKGDIKQWLEHDPAGAKLVRECERAPLWEPAAEKPRTTEADEALVSELAALSTLAYAKRREEAAEEIGITLTMLDKAVVEAKGEAKSVEDEEGWALEPWPDEVQTADLLDALCETYKQYLILPEHGVEAMALWCLHAWTLDAFDISPFLFFRSPLHRCGKTNAMRLIYRTGPRTVLTSNITPAAIFRYVDLYHPTLVIDEADSFFKDNEEARGILNSGHTRDAAFVIRCVGDNSEPRKFSTWAAKALASIGKLAVTLQDRSVILDLKRKRPDQKVVKLRKTDTEEFRTLRRKAARWRDDNIERLRGVEPHTPAALNDRAQDNWEPLFAIADLAGDSWARAARAAALKLSADAEMDVETTKTLLLSDTKDIFAEREGDTITSKAFLTALHADETKPWSSYGKTGKPITERQVARLLADFKIYPRNLKIADELGRQKVVKGYLRSSFAEAFEAYVLPQGGDRSATPLLSSPENGLAEKRSATAKIEVADRNASNPLETNKSSGVADQNPLGGETKPEKVVKKVSGRPCDYCHESPDGTEQQAAYGTETLWLHPDCIDRFLEAQDDGLDIPECLRRY